MNRMVSGYILGEIRTGTREQEYERKFDSTSIGFAAMSNRC